MSVSAVDRSLTAALNQIYGTSGVSGTSQTNAEDVFSTEDSAEISPQAMQLSSLFGTEAGQAITLDDLMKFADKKLKEFQERFEQLLKANGIDMSQPISLAHEPGTGRLKVTNDHPDAAKIEQLLAQDPELRNNYTAATSALEVAKHGQEHSRFAEAYEANPLAATAQFGYLFNSQYDARVTFSQTGYDVSYVRMPRATSSVD